MRVVDLLIEIETMRRRLADLRLNVDLPNSVEIPRPERETILQDALTEIQITLEELQVADEELRRQNEELINTRIKVEMERQRYYNLFDLAPDGHILTDSAGIIREANRAATVLLNATSEYVRGKPFANYITEEHRSAFRAEVTVLCQFGLRTEWETQVKPRGAEPFDAVLTVTPATDLETRKTLFHWVIRDITERKHTGDRLLALNTELENRVLNRTAALEAAYAREHQIAETLQRSLMRTIPEDTFPNLAVFPRYEAALAEARVGGDFYDAFTFSTGKVAVVVGDISGKGLAAAAYTSQVRCVLHAFLGKGLDPEGAMTSVNNFICNAQTQRDWEHDIFVSLTLVIIDPRTGQVTCICAGSEPPLLMRQDGTIAVVPIHGTILGVYPDALYESVAMEIDKGDTILLVTDGITEARNGSDFLGLDGLMEIAAHAPNNCQLSVMADEIFSHARLFAGGSLHDDACVFLIRRV